MIATSLLTSGSSQTDASSYATASVSPGANRLVLVFVVSFLSGAATLSTLSGASMTWVKVADRTFSSNNLRITVFRGLSTAPGSGALTIDFGGTSQSNCGWAVVEFSGVDTGGDDGERAVVQSAVANAGSVNSLTVALAAFADAVNNVAVGVHCKVNSGETLAVGSGFTELVEVTQTEAGASWSAQVEWKTGEDTGVDASHSGTARNYGGVALELQAAVSGRQTIARGVGRGVGRGTR